MRRLNFARSNISGRLFYKGVEFEVQDPTAEHVTVEAVGGDGKAIVRDDDPPRTHVDNSQSFYYVRTSYVSDSHGSGVEGQTAGPGRFMRSYVLLDWLRNVVEVDLSGTPLSGYGLTSLVAATASRLEVLRVNNCAGLDNKGMYAIVALCTALRILDISGCKKLTTHGEVLAHALLVSSRSGFPFVLILSCRRFLTALRPCDQACSTCPS